VPPPPRAHGLQCPHPALVAGAAGLDPLADPHLFLSKLFVEQLVGALLREQLLFAVPDKATVVAVPHAQVAAIQLGDTVGDVLQEAPVVGDEHQRAAETAQLFFQPGDGENIEVVGGLVQQQDVRVAHQRLGQGDTPAPAARQLAHGCLRGQLQLADHGLDPLLQGPSIDALQLLLYPRQLIEVGVRSLLDQLVIPCQQLSRLSQAGCHCVVHAQRVAPGQFLLQSCQAHTGAQPAFAAVRRQLTGQYFQQGGFAGPVATQQAQSVTLANSEVCSIEQYLGAVVQAGGVKS
jgi:hypothetical protein